ncbi:hypothetical protein Bca4012_097018 [Brassica carinata]|uniref:(rape) hypothetical protein n=1 Tax=Brassica napus TaxID=3708 RepID=A0A078GB93_BRANA|nr:60S ribosomal protein L21-1-like [Brassica napus]CAF2116059.1 unnamed protein product [Brassica napus]CDY22626.1 BnaC08g42600D [Brassica napus]
MFQTRNITKAKHVIRPHVLRPTDSGRTRFKLYIRFRFYHGRTGRVWNVTKRAVGVEVNKHIGNRIIKKRIHVRVEHVQQSRCAEEFKLRKKKNDELKAAAKARGETISTKRQAKGPKPGFIIEGMTLETVTLIPYDVVNDLKGGY